MTKALKIKAKDIAKNVDKFDDYEKLILLGGDFDEKHFNTDEKGEEIEGYVDSMIFETFKKFNEYFGRFKSIKTIHMVNWFDSHYGFYQTFLELSAIFPNVEKLILEDFENKIRPSDLKLFKSLKKIELIKEFSPDNYLDSPLEDEPSALKDLMKSVKVESSISVGGGSSEVEVKEQKYGIKGKKIIKIYQGVYEGEHENGKPHGEGTATYDNGNKYVGDFNNNYYHGRGTMKYHNGDIFVGEWVWGQVKEGKMTRAEGRITEGEYKDSYLHGKGTFINLQGTIFIGNFIKGKMEGQGEAIASDGYKYVGEFKNGQLHGEGISTYPDGTTKKTYWKKGYEVTKNN